MINESRNSSLLNMPRDRTPAWSFLTNHARVLLCIAQDPGIRLREIGDAIGITERAAHRIVVELAAAGYLSRTRNGRRNHYTIQSHLPLPDPLARAEDRRPAGRPRRTATGQEQEATGASGAAEKLDWRQVNEDPGGPTQSPLSRFRGWHPSRNELAGRARAGDLPYDGLKEKEIAGELSRLSQVELATVEGYERAHEARPVVLDKLRYMRGSEPLPGYDALTTEQIAEALAGADAETVKAVRDYEKVHRRQSVLDETARV